MFLSMKDDWKTIDSAPEKTKIIGWSKRHGMHIGVIVKYKKPEMALTHGPAFRLYGGWFQPSHWRELPEAPMILKAEADLEGRS
jgi:hypothetical protein